MLELAFKIGKIYIMKDYKFFVKPSFKPIYPDIEIRVGKRESIAFNAKVKAKSFERRQILEAKSIETLEKLKSYEEYRIRFINPFLILEKDDGTLDRKRKVKIGGINRYAVCCYLFWRPSETLDASNVFQQINWFRYVKKKEVYKKIDLDVVYKAARDINDLARKKLGIEEDVILYYVDREEIMINPLFKKIT